jgi:hypothetical protein
MISTRRINLLFLVIMAIAFGTTALGQNGSRFNDTAASYFDEIKEATGKYQSLWNKDLYGPILLVEPQTKIVYANYPDLTGALAKHGNIYSGILPKDVSIANTSTHWGGRDWAMIMLPLPDSKADRINLMAHELFHSAQKSLGFTPANAMNTNSHLDQKDGRIYLRLELEALKRAVQAVSPIKMETDLSNALTFRKYRHLLYAGADTSENMLELHEGIAEYTGFKISGRNKEESIKHLVNAINDFQKNPTYVNSFAYQTIPLYGYLLDIKKPGWNKEITNKANLTQYYINAFGISVPKNLKISVETIKDKYSGQSIIAEENGREEKNKKLVAEYKSKFIEQPHFDLKFISMSISYDPRDIMPLEDKGTVYQAIHVIDKWGVLEVSKGALMSPNWDKITVGLPIAIDSVSANGEGWILQLNKGWTVKRDFAGDNYFLDGKAGKQ